MPGLVLVLRKLCINLVFCLNEGKQVFSVKKLLALLWLANISGFPCSHQPHTLFFSLLAKDCQCETDQNDNLNVLPQGLSITGTESLVILVDTDSLTSSCGLWKRKLCSQIQNK